MSVMILMGKKGYEKFEIENILLHIWNQEISTPSVYAIYTGWI